MGVVRDALMDDAAQHAEDMGYDAADGQLISLSTQLSVGHVIVDMVREALMDDATQHAKDMGCHAAMGALKPCTSHGFHIVKQ